MKLWSPIAGLLFIVGSLVVLIFANQLAHYPLFFPLS
ncbi:hypothetical protein GKIL_3849 [Gloeobacter kilaueensis JS1]|uniref:Uncharacterized protein n=1 Tax=Gloeobacter kilaueensis (strain ATCC BAA-2537 / CCAP 1431/1 / ULC 316 / JS1) TaxID=1183438 RepID=U5QQV7_GLOK1|nr:hypothetical protein GKIL_3849 [Gloeobacter kilaueensis JS1]